MAKIVTGILKTPKNADGERYIVHPETDSSQVLMDSGGTTLQTKMKYVDSVLSIVDPDGSLSGSVVEYATDEEVEEIVVEVFGSN